MIFKIISFEEKCSQLGPRNTRSNRYGLASIMKFAAHPHGKVCLARMGKQEIKLEWPYLLKSTFHRYRYRRTSTCVVSCNCVVACAVFILPYFVYASVCIYIYTIYVCGEHIAGYKPSVYPGLVTTDQ